LSYRASTCRTNNAVEVSSVKKSEAVGQITGKPDRALDNDAPNAVTGDPVEHLWLITPLFHARWHLRDGHQRLRHLVQQLTRILLLTKRHCEKLNDRRLTQLQRQISGGGIGTDLVVFHPLCSTNQSEVGGGIILLLALALARLQKPLPMRTRDQADTPYTTTRQDNASNGCSDSPF
jgi:hypothetical protein